MTTIKDIARAAGVSATAVSKTIRGQGKVSKATHDRIMKLAKEMNYQPNMNARALVKRQSNIIGLIVPNGAIPFCGRIFKGAFEATLSTDFRLMMSAHYDKREALEGAVRSLRDSGCENILLHDLYTDESYIQKLAKEVPGFVLIGRFVQSIQERCVWMDNVLAGRMAAQHLLSKGHRKIAIVSSNHVKVDSAERVLGIRHILELEGIELLPSQICSVGFTESSIEHDTEMVKRLIKTHVGVTAVIVFNDRLAVEVAHIIRSLKVEIPSDISIIGFDDSIFCNTLSPKLTSVKYPIEEMSAYAVDLSLKLTHKDTFVPPNAHLFFPSISERESVAQLAL